jgi:hypothetical protein
LESLQELAARNEAFEGAAVNAEAIAIPGGYILLARKILDSELMNKPPHYLKLWVWMISRAFWKDGNKLLRGQFHTTIEEMQEACSYRVGNRVCRPTVKEIRDAYESFSKGSRIGRRKGTRGMVITILNYDYFQNPDNYEGHPEGQPDGNPKGTGKIKKKKTFLKPLPTKTPPADSRLFSDWFCYAFTKIEGDRYFFEGGKDGKLLSSMLATVPLKELVAKACHFLTDDHRFPPGRPTLSGLKASINRYSSYINGKEDHFRALGIIPPEHVLLEEWAPWK